MPRNEPGDAEPLCPSAPPHLPESVLIGVLSGTPDAPRIVPTAQAVPVTAEVLELAGPVSPREVFRFAATCRGSACVHFQDSACRIAAGSAALLDEVVDELPACPIRRQCRWFRQEGPSICRRCPQIVTEQYRPSAQMLRIVNATDPPP